jgi:membrane protease YdiL (CAAX protease family)
MPGVCASDILKTWLYAAASVLLGSWAAPFFYNAGKALAEVSKSKDINGPVKWLAGICRSADFPAFFQASLLIAAGILFLPFIEWLHGGRAGACFKTWLRRLPHDVTATRWVTAFRQAGIGFLVVPPLFFLLANVLVWTHVLEWKNPGGPVSSLLWQGFAFALGLAIFQEILLRGIAMGIFLRVMRPPAAIAMAAFLFSFVHFLNPPPGLNVADPDASGVGFELLRAIAASFFQPYVLFGTFAPLLALGGVLAYARWRTGSLGLSMGLHTGWIFIHSLLRDFTVAHEKSAFWGVSDSSLRQGIIPLAGILFIGFLVLKFTTHRDATDPSI